MWRESASPADTFSTIRDGLRGTSMPAWPILSDDETWDVVAYLLDAGESR